ncbi:hypothetical protein [Streptomyces paromomycinus]|uniref:Uncharacterized protein n=1 Tax=Streptomyces paromomycinus TaxID=92743 RepID=A0A401VXW1_STREY|nr:hypothetical protein [Streptomyces paromomycinus]GCD41923.1 hypothetical protein GKJPGBOP_01581 [Streptomyces paromomycinus]
MFSILLLTAVAIAVSWFVCAVRTGFRDRSYAMPASAICFTFSVDVSVTAGSYERWFPSVPMWALGSVFVIPDALLICQVLAYGPKDFPRISPKTLRWVFLIVMALGAGAAPVLSHSLHDTHGVYAAVATILVVSVCYPVMLYNRGSVQGQSVTVASLWLLLTVIAPNTFFLAPPEFRLTDRWLLGYMGAVSTILAASYLIAVILLRTGKIHFRERGRTCVTEPSGVAP